LGLINLLLIIVTETKPPQPTYRITHRL